jgi:hypothetical protein
LKKQNIMKIKTRKQSSLTARKSARQSAKKKSEVRNAGNSTRILVTCYRKAYPQEVLHQLEPVLRKAGFRWWDIIGLFQKELRKRGFQVYEIPDGQIGPPDGGDIRYVFITDEREDLNDSCPLPAPQVLRPSVKESP